jgi:hypothetical protein
MVHVVRKAKSRCLVQANRVIHSYVEIQKELEKRQKVRVLLNSSLHMYNVGQFSC